MLSVNRKCLLASMLSFWIKTNPISNQLIHLNVRSFLHFLRVTESLEKKNWCTYFLLHSKNDHLDSPLLPSWGGRNGLELYLHILYSSRNGKAVKAWFISTFSQFLNGRVSVATVARQGRDPNKLETRYFKKKKIKAVFECSETLWFINYVKLLLCGFVM